jgi:hypothetical protein
MGSVGLAAVTAQLFQAVERVEKAAELERRVEEE